MSSYKVFIYGLFDPRNPSELRYIGKTNRSLSTRLIEHISQSKSSRGYSTNWVKSLLSVNILPEIKLLEESNENDWEEREKFHIAFYKNNGHRLTNSEEGGLSHKVFRSGKNGEKRLKNTSKEVVQTNLDGDILNTFVSCSAAQEELGFSRHVIAACCRGKQTKAYGYRWYFKDEPERKRLKRKHTKEVTVIFNETGEMKEFNSITECVKFLKLSRSYIDNLIKGDRVNSMYKLTFKT